MTNLEGFYVVLLAAIAFSGYKLYGAVSRFSASFRAVSRLCVYLNKNKGSISRLVDSLEECVSGKNKINQDQVDANIALVREVSKLRECVAAFTAAVMPPQEPQNAPMTAELLEAKFEDTYKELIDQGVDPFDAKWKAAEYEMSKLVEIDENIGIGA